MRPLAAALRGAVARALTSKSGGSALAVRTVTARGDRKHRTMATFSGKVSPDGQRYLIPDGTRQAYERDGYVVLKGFLAEPEVAPIEIICGLPYPNPIEVVGGCVGCVHYSSREKS